MTWFVPFAYDREARLRSPLTWPLYFMGPSTALVGGIVLGIGVYALIVEHNIAFGHWWLRTSLFLLIAADGLLTASIAMMLARQILFPLRNHIFLLPCAVVWFDSHVLRDLIQGYFRASGWPLDMRVVTADMFVATRYDEWLAVACFALGCTLLALRLRHPDSDYSDGNGSLWIAPSRRRALAAAAGPAATPAPAPAQKAAALPAPAAKPVPTAPVPAQPGYRNPAVAPRLDFQHLYGNAEFKAALLDDARRWRETWGQAGAAAKNGILLFGAPGTGKTAFSEALAGELGMRFMKVTFGSLASRWINQSTEQLTQIFDEAQQQAPCVLFIDEVDAVLRSRDDLVGQPAEYSNMVDVFLERAEAIRGSRILLVAATNYIDRLDSAAVREARFDFRHEVPLPDAAAREGLLRQGLAGGHCTTDDATMARLVRRWAGFNVPRLLACGASACEFGRVRQGLPERPGQDEPEAPAALTYTDFYRALRKLQGRKGGAPEGAKRLSELFMDPPQEKALRTLATELTRVDEVERLGGVLPKGVLFCGQPGTGKTASAMALAYESDWSFITRTGRQLLADGAVQKLGQEASDLRPAIVFIDEADDILGNRATSPYKAATNELLTLIDGAKGMLADVVWVAATNHPEAMDSAAVRGGRFGRRIVFDLPSRATVERIVADWVQRKLAAKAVRLDAPADAWVAAASAVLAGLAPSDIYQILEESNTAAIAEALESGKDPVLKTAAIAVHRNSTRSSGATL